MAFTKRRIVHLMEITCINYIEYSMDTRWHSSSMVLSIASVHCLTTKEYVCKMNIYVLPAKILFGLLLTFWISYFTIETFFFNDSEQKRIVYSISSIYLLIVCTPIVY